MPASVSEQEDVSTKNEENECSSEVNWPAIYVLGGLMLVMVVVTVWVAAYTTAISNGLLLIGGTLFYIGKAREEAGHESRYWTWSAGAVFAAVIVWNLVQLAPAFMT